jgi:hypothetical protein
MAMKNHVLSFLLDSHSLLSKIKLWPIVRTADSGQRAAVFADAVLKQLVLHVFYRFISNSSDSR